eukprot:COSAG01_NODE_63804_length_278_cov_2.134078_1_plen_22_part_01
MQNAGVCLCLAKISVRSYARTH